MRWLRGTFSERSLLLLLSLIIATALWYFVRDVTRVTVPARPGTVVKTVPVVPTVTGKPAEGFALEGFDVDPTAVALVGPPGVMNDITAAPTQPIDIAGARTDVTRMVDFRLPPAVLTRGSALVTVRISSQVVRSFVDDVEVVLEGITANRRVQVDPAFITVEIEGPAEVVTALSPSKLRATINVGVLDPGRHGVRPKIKAPGGVVVLGLKPSAVTVTIRRG